MFVFHGLIGAGKVLAISSHLSAQGWDKMLLVKNTGIQSNNCIMVELIPQKVILLVDTATEDISRKS